MEKKKFYPHINALRFVAILSTVAGHWALDSGITDNRVQWGEYGVDLFFTISGFLITLNLLESTQEHSLKLMDKIKNFYINRSLRIFPPYFALLIILFLIHILMHFTLWVKGTGLYFFTYTSNFLFYLKGFPPVSYLNHTWSLAVEEQFYILWPLFILFIPEKKMHYLIYGFILVGLLTHFFHPMETGKRYQGYVRFLPNANFHTLGVGALLSYIIKKKQSIVELLPRLLNPVFCLLIFCLAYFLKAEFPQSRLIDLFHELILCLTTMSLVFNAWRGYKGLTKKIFDSTLVQYIGKTSYGIYLFETPVSFLLLNACIRLRFDFWGNPALRIMAFACATLVCSYVSFRFFEQPILRLKKKYY